MTKTWFVTGSASGLGAEITRAALLAGHQVVATDRDLERLKGAFDQDDDNILVHALDISDAAQIASAVEAAVKRFGRIDVLVNNAGFGQFGPFETNTHSELVGQFSVNVFGTFQVTKAVLKHMRRQRGGHVFNMSSNGGIAGVPGGSLYSASKFAIEGASEALAWEVAQFGIKVTLIEPGAFRTDFLAGNAIRYGTDKIEDYTEYALKLRSANDARSHKQLGDPAKLGAAIVKLADVEHPPLHFVAGSDAFAKVEAKLKSLETEMSQWRELSMSTDSTE
jgi:NAD(P)-dependent dehydrogenase (short-subunit alcohol dehydrogenase family)